MRTVYEARNWSYQVQHGAVWGNQEFSMSGLYSAPPAVELGNQTLKGKPLQTSSAELHNYSTNEQLLIVNCYPPNLRLKMDTDCSCHANLSLILVQIKCIPRWTSLEVTLERSLQSRLDSVSLGWMRHGRAEQVRVYKVCHDHDKLIIVIRISLIRSSD